MYDSQALEEDAKYIYDELKKIRPDIVFKVIVLKGSGNDPRPKDDLIIIREAIEELQLAT